MIEGENRCPKCDRPMRAGTLGTGSFVGGAAWYPKRSELALGGEAIVSKPLGGMVWIDGHRCSDCRLLVLEY